MPTTFSQCRAGPWRTWILAWALLCFAGLYGLGEAHIHKGEATDYQCPICHVLGHHSFDLPGAAAPSVPPVLLLYFLAAPVFASVRPRVFHVFPPAVRGPPAVLFFR